MRDNVCSSVSSFAFTEANTNMQTRANIKHGLTAHNWNIAPSVSTIELYIKGVKVEAHHKRTIQNWFTKLWRTKWIPLPNRFTGTININSKTKRITHKIMGGPNAELLWEIRTVLYRPPWLIVHWMKVKAHRKREAVLVHKLLNDAAGELTHKVHDDPDWQARVKRWSTGTGLHHCTSGTKHWGEMSHRELW